VLERVRIRGANRMPTIPYDYLEKVSFHILTVAGVPEEEAHIVASHQVKANLVGHDSHGIILLPSYIDRIREGHIVPGAAFEVASETPTTACINGHWGFGFVVTEKAMRMAIQKAKANGLAAVTVHYQSHIGRLGGYSTLAAQQNMIGLITADSGAGPKAVVPYGGRERRLGTNPLSIALPSNLDGPVLLDMATSAVAAGKIEVARARKESVPLGWIVDKDGNPTTDPNDFYAGGSLLPFGGERGHKGYILSFVVEVLSSILTGMGVGADRKTWEARHGVEYRHNDGCFISVFNVEAFYPLADFKREVTELAKFVKSSAPAKDFKQILYPGEIEWLTELKRRKEGIPVEDETWERIIGLIREYKLESVIGKP
jgi:LDH2 family malate/lactate/ureidoglycolate dehydrogenase